MEEVEEADLDARGRRGVDEDPFFGRGGGGLRACRGAPRVGEAVGGWGGGEGRGDEVGWRDGFADEVGFADPGALGVGEDYGDGVAGALEG